MTRGRGRLGSLGRLVGPLVSLVALAAVVAWALRQPRPQLPDGGAALAALGVALGVYALGTALRAERWRRILARDGQHVPPGEALGLTLVGYMGNNVLPARAGDLMRAGLLARRRRTGMAPVLGTVIAERVLDALALIVLLVAVAPLAPPLPPAAWLAAGIAVAVLAAAAAGALVAARRAPASRAGRLLRRAAPLARSTRALAGPHGLAMLALSVGVWACEAAVFLAVAHAAGVDLGPAGALAVMAVTNLVGLVPAGPGYVGTFDAAVVLASRAAGAGGAHVVPYVVLLRLVLFVPITVAGLAVLLTRHAGGVRRPLPAAATETG